jgi:tetratricopeptide (TPR) repeat protein
MRVYYIVIGMAVVVIALLGTFAVLQDSQLTTEKARSAELQKKVESLEQEVTALKNTDDNYFQRGVDLQYAGKFREAKEAFEIVITKFPSSNLAAMARERLIYVNDAIAHPGAGEMDKGTK